MILEARQNRVLKACLPDVTQRLFLPSGESALWWLFSATNAVRLGSACRRTVKDTSTKGMLCCNASDVGGYNDGMDIILLEE